MAKQPDKSHETRVAEPASAATPAPDASPAPAAAPASTAELTHKLRMYGAVIETSFCHRRARLTFNAGASQEFSSAAGESPSAFEQARNAAKAAYVAAHAPKKKPTEENK